MARSRRAARQSHPTSADRAAAVPPPQAQHELLRLQQLVGNQAVARLLRAAAEEDCEATRVTPAPTTAIQRKPKFLKKMAKGLGKLRNLVKPRRNKKPTAQAEEQFEEATPVEVEMGAVEQIEDVAGEAAPAPPLEATAGAAPAQTTPDSQVLVDVPPTGMQVRGTVLYFNGTEYSLEDLEQSRLAAGGFGVVYKLTPRVPGTGPSLVLKAPLRENEAHRAGIENEAATAMALGEHPNLAKTHGVVNVDSPSVYQNFEDYFARPTNVVIMDYLGGGTLKDLLGTRGSNAGTLLAALEAGRISYSEYVGVNQYIEHEILKGLQRMHAAGFGHFDIKPENVMFDDDFNVKIIDLGGATKFGAPLSTVTAEWQSPEYAALKAAGKDTSPAGTEAYDIHGIGLWAAMPTEHLRARARQKEKAEGRPSPQPVGNVTSALGEHVRVATGAAPGGNSIDTLLKGAQLDEPLIDADQARDVLRFIHRWAGNRKLERERPATEPIPAVAPIPEPAPGAPASASLPPIGELLDRGEIELQALVPHDALESGESAEEEISTG